MKKPIPQKMILPRLGIIPRVPRLCSALAVDQSRLKLIGPPVYKPFGPLGSALQGPGAVETLQTKTKFDGPPPYRPQAGPNSIPSSKLTAVRNSLQLKRPIGSQGKARFFSSAVQLSHGKTLYANCKGSYTDGTGATVAFDERDLELSGNVTGHASKTDYEAMIKKALKKNKTIPKEIADGNIVILEYSTYTRKS